MQRILLIQIFLFLIITPVVSQTKEIIVRWSSSAEVPTVTQFKPVRLLSPRLNVEMYEVSTERVEEFLGWAKRADAGIRWEYNVLVQLRATPNDSRYNEQFRNLQRSGFPEAWDVTPGGHSPDGAEIVVAVLDAGFDVDHEDLEPSLWNNRGEVPGDGRDNDGNGYVDDVHGWDLVGNDGMLPEDTHGTQVAGVLGAKGNNGRGITGTNWDVQMMLFSFRTVADVIEAYEYVRYQRELWNDTDGAEGAYVVATNASFGIEGGTCANHPVWGGMYDELGKVGILTAAATANFSWDVDQNGDMPTDCPSDFVIGVANLGPNDILWRSSAYGSEHVDLAAPGEGSYSTLTGSRYGGFGSTSASAPLVSGAIALLYATPCPEFQELVVRDPEAAALFTRDVLLSGTRKLRALEFRTASGGALDIAESQRLLLESCATANGTDFGITAARPNPTGGLLELVTNTRVFSEGGRVEVHDMLGRHVVSLQPARVGDNPVVLRVDLSSLPAGFYFLQVRERDREAATRIVVR